MSDPIPFRLRVLQALTTSLQGITIANGYRHDLASAVFRGRSMYGEDDPLPLVSILEVPVPLDPLESPHGSTDSTGDWELLLQGFVLDDPENPTDPAHYLMADVKKALVRERRRKNTHQEPDILGMGRGASCVTALHIGSGAVLPASEVSAYANFWLRITVKIVEDNEDPFA